MNRAMMMYFDPPRRRARRAAAGLSVIGLGVLALLDNLHVFDVSLLRTFWPLVFVVWGAARMVWPSFSGSRWFGLILIVAGALMTAHNLGYGSLDFRQWWPVFVIFAGASILLRGTMPQRFGRHGRRCDPATTEHGDEVNLEATFSGAKLKNDSHDFKGGHAAVTFGGLELDLREAVMVAPEATLNISATFGGLEIRVPRDWQIVVQMSATMGAVEDKTTPPAAPEHRLVLRGETVFGGVEIKN